MTGTDADLERIVRLSVVACCPNGCDNRSGPNDLGGFGVCQASTFNTQVEDILGALTLQDIAREAAKHGMAVVKKEPPASFSSQAQANYRMVIAMGAVTPE